MGFQELEVGAHADAGVHADRAAKRVWVEPGVLERLDRALEEQPLLRIHGLGLTRAEPEEACIEEVDAIEDTARRDVRRIPHQLGIDAGGDQLVVREELDGLHAIPHVLPEGVDAAGSRKATAHPDDGYRLDGARAAHGAAAVSSPAPLTLDMASRSMAARSATLAAQASSSVASARADDRPLSAPSRPRWRASAATVG